MIPTINLSSLAYMSNATHHIHNRLTAEEITGYDLGDDVDSEL